LKKNRIQLGENETGDIYARMAAAEVRPVSTRIDSILLSHTAIQRNKKNLTRPIHFAYTVLNIPKK
jgi:hypothetical protein